VQDSFPSVCSSVSWSTAETVNSHYGPLDAGPSNLFIQTFTTSITTPMIHAVGPIAKGLTIPRTRPADQAAHNLGLALSVPLFPSGDSLNSDRTSAMTR
jgi:hypothetical protein